MYDLVKEDNLPKLQYLTSALPLTTNLLQLETGDTRVFKATRSIIIPIPAAGPWTMKKALSEVANS